jgi:hypothetical protein
VQKILYLCGSYSCTRIQFFVGNRWCLFRSTFLVTIFILTKALHYQFWITLKLRTRTLCRTHNLQNICAIYCSYTQNSEDRMLYISYRHVTYDIWEKNCLTKMSLINLI